MSSTSNDSGRRSFLKWVSGLLAAGNAAVVGVPTISYAVSSLQKRDGQEAAFRRVARLKDLPEDKPVMVPIIGDKQDAWTRHASEAIGRAWLARGAIDEADPKKTKLAAHSALCSHLGCAIQLTGDGQQYICPCHNAMFTLAGEKIEPKTGRRCPAPRGMDPLPYQVVQDAASQEWWVEIKYELFEQGLAVSKAVT